MYGIEHSNEAVLMTKKVVSIFGGGHKTVMMILGICCVETDMGTYPDKHPEKWGVGLTQFDEIAFEDLQKRARGRHRKMLKRFFGYDLNTVKFTDLADDAMLALCLTRMKLLLIPEPIPTTLEAQARYWKEYWNTKAGKGRVEHYMSDVARFMPKVV